VRKTVYCTFTIVSRWIFPRTRNISDKRDREIQNIHFMFNNFFSKNRTFYEICDLIYYSQTGYRWQHNTAHTPCTLDIYGYRHTHTHTHRICNTSCFSTSTIVARTHLNVTFIRIVTFLQSVTTQWRTLNHVRWEQWQLHLI